MPAVTVLYFASLRERRGVPEERVSFSPGTTLAELYVQLFPTDRVPVAYARNTERVSGDTVIEDGDEIVFLPPLGGG